MRIGVRRVIKLIEITIFIQSLFLIINVNAVRKKHPHGHEIQLTFSNLNQSNHKDLTEILEHPEVRDRKIMILSIIGAYRKGKSFFLDYCLRYLYSNYQSINRIEKGNFQKVPEWWGEPDEPLTGFSWAPGSTANTKGILLWNDVFLCDRSDGEKIAIVLLDTQGLFELNGNANLEAKIFGITSFLSSVEIFNLNGVIQEDQLGYLKMVTDFSNVAMERQQNNSVNTSWKTFQNLILLVRDWSDEEVGYGWEGGQKYLKENIFIESTNNNSTAGTVRRSIRNSFDNISAFLLPHPGKDATKGKYDGRWSGLDDDFKEEMKHLIESLFAPDKLVTKKIFGREIKAHNLAVFKESLYTSFQSSELPKVDSLFNVIVEAQLKELVEHLQHEYKAMMESLVNYNSTNFSNSLFKIYVQASNITIEKFREAPKMSDRNLESQYEEHLRRKMSNYFSQEWSESKNAYFTRVIMVEKINNMFEEYQNVTNSQINYDDKNFIKNLKVIHENTSLLVLEKFKSYSMAGVKDIDGNSTASLNNKFATHYKKWREDEIDKFERVVEKKLKVLVDQISTEYKSQLDENLDWNLPDFQDALSQANKTAYGSAFEKYENDSKLGESNVEANYKVILNQKISDHFEKWKFGKIEIFKKNLRKSLNKLNEKYKRELDKQIKSNDSNAVKLLSDADEGLSKEIMDEYMRLPKIGIPETDSEMEDVLKNDLKQSYLNKYDEVDKQVRTRNEMIDRKNIMVLVLFNKFKEESELSIPEVRSQEDENFALNLRKHLNEIKKSMLDKYKNSLLHIDNDIMNDGQLELEKKISQHLKTWIPEQVKSHEKYILSISQGTWTEYNGFFPEDAVKSDECFVVKISGGYDPDIGVVCSRNGEVRVGHRGTDYSPSEYLRHPSYAWKDENYHQQKCITDNGMETGRCICRVRAHGYLTLGVMRNGKCRVYARTWFFEMWAEPRNHNRNFDILRISA